MLRKIFITTFLIFSFSNPALSAFSSIISGVPDVYRVTVYEMSLCSDSECSSPKIIGSNSSGKVFDIASSVVGETVGSFVNSLNNIDSGTYTHIRFTVARSFTMSGQLSAGGSTYYTNSSGTDYTSAVATALALDESQSKIYVGATTSSSSKGEIVTFVSDVSINNSSLVQLNPNDSSKVDYIIALTSPLSWSENSKYGQYALDFDISGTLVMSDAVSGTSSNWVSYIVAPSVSFSSL